MAPVLARTRLIRWTASAGVAALLCVASFQFVAYAQSFRMGVIGSVKDVSEDGKSFEIKGRGISKTLVFDDKETEFKKVEVKPFTEFKEGDRIFVLGKKTEGNERVEASISSILAMASGDFEEPSELPAKQQKMKGLEWVAGSLEKDGKQLKLAGAILTTGGKRPVAVFKKARRGDLWEKKKQVFVRGKFSKKEKGEKFHRIMASTIILVDKKVSSKEYAFLFDMSNDQKKRK